MSSKKYWTQGDYVTLKINALNEDDGLPIDLSGHSLYIQHWFDDKPATQNVASLIAPSLGTGSFAVPGISDSGVFRWQWFIKDGVGKEFGSTQIFEKRIKKRKIATLQ